LHPDLQLDKLYKGEVFLEVPKFRTNVFWELIWYKVEELLCFQVGWNSDPIYVIIRAGFNVMECFKNLIYTFTDWSQWDPKKMSGANAIFDVCTSSITSNAQVFRYSLYTLEASLNNFWSPPITWDTSTPQKMTSQSWCITMPFFVDNIGMG